MNFIVSAITSAYSWFVQLLSSTGYLTTYIVVIALGIICTYLLFPFLRGGFGGSDSVSETSSITTHIGSDGEIKGYTRTESSTRRRRK